MTHCQYCQSQNIVVKPHQYFTAGMRECADCGRKLGAAAQDLSNPNNLGTVWFGRHYGTRWLDLPESYLRWLLSEVKSAKVQQFASATLRHREILPSQQLEIL
jgi:hypothetical protein